MLKYFTILSAIIALCLQAEAKIDRKAVVERHNPELNQVRPESPSQVGNGEFTFNFDITGLQTFIPFNTMSHWGWHSLPMPKGVNPYKDFKGFKIKTNGRDIVYPCSEKSLRHYSKTYRESTPTPQQSPEQMEMAEWLKCNPHAFNLGRIGLEIVKSDGKPAALSDIKNSSQTINLYTGIAESSFSVDGKPVRVTTICNPDRDTISIKIISPLLKDGKIKVFFAFPYGDPKEFQEFIGDWNKPSAHKSEFVKTPFGAEIKRTADDLKYFVNINWQNPAEFKPDTKDPHKFVLEPKSDTLAFSCDFSKSELPEAMKKLPLFEETLARSEVEWRKYWESGAAIDLSESIDPRWRELERRVILSLYLMRVQECGSLPPQESGLLSNSWHGRFHYEMIWWHAVHFGAWGRPELAEKQLDVFRKYLPDAIERAKGQGYAGARWPKCTANSFSEWPHIIHSTLLWQQPHPIYFAEQAYRLNPTKETLDKWKDVVFQTAEFMADFPVLDPKTRIYNLEPPITVVSESTDCLETRNPTFELSYWRYGLRTALKWLERMGMPENEKWRTVLDGLAPLPVENGLYVRYEGIPDMWTKFNYEHPALIGTLGMLPGDGVDRNTFKRTLEEICHKWHFERCWGWDFPMLAMAAARTGNSQLAISMLLHPTQKFQFDEHGIATGGPCPYFPSNGGFLTAVAMMAGGWEGANSDEFDNEYLGFPRDGNWKVKAEGFPKYE